MREDIRDETQGIVYDVLVTGSQEFVFRYLLLLALLAEVHDGRCHMLGGCCGNKPRP